MNAVIEPVRNDVPIVADATLLTVPNMNDEAARGEYLKKIRALRNQPSTEVEPSQSAPAQPELLTLQPDTDLDTLDDVPSVDAVPADTAATRTRLSKEDLQDYDIPVTDEDGNVEYLSYDEFVKTVGLYSKQNKRARDLAEREREVEVLKTQLSERNAQALAGIQDEASKLENRYTWVQNSIAHAHKHSLDIVEFEDGTKRKLTQLIAEKTALENGYTELLKRRAQAEQQLRQAQEDFVSAQDKILEERAPTVRRARADIAKFLERSGFTNQEAQALSHAKAELLMVLDKAMKYDNAQRSSSREKKVGSNTKVLKQPSRLAGRGTPVNQPANTRMQELQSRGMKATADELRELRRLQLQSR